MNGPALIDQDSLGALEAAIARAFATGAHDHLRILGYGEISSVVEWPGAAGRVACKRLPIFPDRARFSTYAACLERYLDRLAQAGVEVLETQLCAIDLDSGRVAGYLVQPVLQAAALGPKVLAAGDEAQAQALFDRVLTRVLGCISPSLGLDSQLSNWALMTSDGAPERLVYLDVSTPLMRDDRGREALDADLFLSSLPFALRGLVKRFMLGSILATYYDPRRAIVDLLANLHKERLTALLPDFITRANDRLGARAITLDEVARYYRDDARTWALLQRLRRLDRGWQIKVRRRPYPFLLPGPIER